MTDRVQLTVITAAEVAERESLEEMWHEIANGEWIEDGEVPNQRHNLIAKRLLRPLDDFVTQHQLGEVYGDGMNFVLLGTPGNIIIMRVPDVAFLREALVDRTHDDYYYLAPDLAVEVVSPSEIEHPERLSAKIADYLHYGARQVWAVYPDEKKVEVHTPDGNLATYTDSVPGGDLLPGFALELDKIFA